jgi:hypothetical protein
VFGAEVSGCAVALTAGYLGGGGDGGGFAGGAIGDGGAVGDGGVVAGGACGITVDGGVGACSV